MKKVLLVLMIVTLMVGGYLAFTAVDSKTPVVMAAKKMYNATVYVAGHGGHFAKVDVTVNPNDADNPIKIHKLEKVDIGDTKSHKTHDARIDANNSNILFWSTYALDANGKQHVGKSDLKTGKVIKDVAMDPDPRSPGKKGPLYCASGQSKKYYMPVFMGTEGYIDVLDKETLEQKHRVFISDLGYKAGTYQFVHGVNSNDMKKFAIAISQLGDDGKMNGKQDVIIVDLPSLEKGKMKQLAKATFSGEPAKTITFRLYFSKDDKYIFQSAADRMWMIDANTLKLIDEKITPGQNHDIMPSPDGKYALLTLRVADSAGCDPEGKPAPGIKITDGALVLYDVEAKKISGRTTSVCFGCHKDMGLGNKDAILCGLDANYKK